VWTSAFVNRRSAASVMSLLLRANALTLSW
jgi:hypothetical protein